MRIAAWQRNLIMGLFAGLMLVSFTGCENQGAAPAPPASLGSDQTDGERSSNLKKSASKKSSSNDEEDETDSDNASGSKSRSFDYGGAAIGDDDAKDAVGECHKSGKVYDRFANDAAGACGKLLLAKMNCTESGIKKVLTDRLVKQFEEAIAGSYAGWIIDQCGDCPPGSSDKLCESSTGAKQTGTKVFFVKEEGDEVRGKAMVLPTRPGQDDDAEASQSDEE